MTRINAGVFPEELHRLHLIAEYRELPMVPASLRRSLRTRRELDILRNIPSQFTLNRGHVSFFYNKLIYLRERYELLKKEMRARGYFVDEFRDPGLGEFPTSFYGDWDETEEARAEVLIRIALRKAGKPHLYVNP